AGDSAAQAFWRPGAYWTVMDTGTWATVAGAAVAGLVAGRLAVVAAAWVPGYIPARRVPSLRCPHGTGLRAADLMPGPGWRRLRAALAQAAPALGAWPLAVELLTAGVFAVSNSTAR